MLPALHGSMKAQRLKGSERCRNAATVVAFEIAGGSGISGVDDLAVVVN
jgi:hypothetical protein